MEGIEFLHERNIAHMDMYHDQVVVASERHVAFHKEVQAGKAYIIDFDRSKYLKSGPGIQHAIDLPETYCKPPLGMTRFDPCSWDVYCTGILFNTVTKVSLLLGQCSSWTDSPVTDIYSERHIPWVVRRYIKWLVGNERGCTRICSCRPSARRARQS
ncbi:hypothetical protein K466DRAFT_387675 [Polyporus arcularius HHB13444]|uniref:Protein kinase domain-containing protein n=1 Tax=Polyporus arcularius HHB13444 TaxID=1314778 RepID=A0A5C3NRU9_9APHY|nr:hypothetical protein K466DRAFT_387675 [Polyporus arcularius HHB13444]